jgi:hypothetical protein
MVSSSTLAGLSLSDGYVLIPIALAAIGVAAFYLYRPPPFRLAAGAACCRSPTENKDKLNV